jgi:putative flippase GtrA
MRDSALEARPVSAGAQLLSFLIIGGGAALAFMLFSTLAIALLPGPPRWVVSSGCYALFIVPVYLLHRRFSFRSDAPHSRALPRYVTVQICGLALAAAFSFVAYGVLGLPSLVAAALVIGLTSGVNFMILRLWAFAGR